VFTVVKESWSDVSDLEIAQHLLTIVYREEETARWLLSEAVSGWNGSLEEKGWRFLRQALERYDSENNDYAYTKVAFDTVLTYQRSPPPPWLVALIEVGDFLCLSLLCFP
jgi:hypothetical protein